MVACMVRWARQLSGAVTLSLLVGACGFNPLVDEAEVRGLVEFPPPAPTPVRLPSSVDPFDPESVTRWQQVLVQMGHDITPDGVFGEETFAATVALQTELGLPGTGVVDPATIFALGLRWPPGDSAPPADEPEPTPTPVPEPTPDATLALPTPGDAEIAIDCDDVEGASLPHRAEFLVSVADPGDAIEFGIDYGDASQYVTADWTDAQLNGFVHRYTRAGTFNVVVWVRWDDERTATASCRFVLQRGDAPASDAPQLDLSDEPQRPTDPDDALPTGPPGG